MVPQLDSVYNNPGEGAAMKSVDFLYLSQKDVVTVGLTMIDAISIVETVLTEHGSTV